MSILLEALRKTEKQQKPAPTIHDEAPQGSEPDAPTAWPLVGMIVVALFASGWAVWRQYAAPEGAHVPATAVESAQVEDAQAADTDRPAQGTPGKTERQAAPARPTPAGGATSRRSRTPVESYRPPVTSNSPAATGEADSNARTTDPGAAANRRAAPSTAGTVVANTPRQPVQATDGPHIPEPIGYWELPDAVRANVPEIKFSVLVYDDDPAARFVLVNGLRLGEGDELQQGVKVVEIRRDGVVFSYRLYSFLVGR